MQHSTHRLHRLAGALLLAVSGLVATPPVAAGGTQVGVLTCDSVPGTRVNLIIRSTTDIRCQFKDQNGQIEHYIGETGIALGADLTFDKRQETFAFTVITTSTGSATGHALAGKYVGGKASASLGVGLGAAALVGGDGDNFSLQPLAIESNRGLGVAGGIGFLYIERAP